MGQTRPLLFIFIFSHDKYNTNLTINGKSVDDVLGTRTLGGRMVGADKSTELWRHPCSLFHHFKVIPMKGPLMGAPKVGT